MNLRSETWRVVQGVRVSIRGVLQMRAVKASSDKGQKLILRGQRLRSLLLKRASVTSHKFNGMSEGACLGGWGAAHALLAESHAV